MSTDKRKSASMLLALLLTSAVTAQTPPWIVTLTPTFNPLPIGFCGAVRLTLLDPVTKDVPRNPLGNRISMADFDLTVSGTVVAGQQIDATHFSACGCQTGTPGAVATITAKYPAQFLPAAARVPGVAFQKTATVTLSPSKGSVNPPDCITLANNTPDSGTTTPANGSPFDMRDATPIAQVAPGRTPVTPGASPTPAPASSAPPATAPPATAPPVAAPPVSAPPATTPAPASSMPSGGAPAPVTAPPPTRTHGGAAPGTAPPATAPPAPVTSAPLVPVNPSDFVALQGQPGEVLLQWTPVAGAEFYVVFGPGVTNGGQRVEQGANASAWPGANKMGQPALNVPAGSQEWAVASYYANNLTTPAAEFPRARLNVQGVAAPTPPPATASTPAPSTSAPVAASGKYLVTITGIRAYQATTDDLLSRDGTGDEVYAGAYVRRYDRRDGRLMESSPRKSMPHGDTYYFANQRVQAGTKTATGGIQDGDMIPGPALIAMRSVLPQDTTFPLRLWEGTLVDGIDVVVLSPSLWEQDVGDGFYQKWQQFQATLNPLMMAKQGIQDQISQQSFSSVVFGASSNDTYTAGLSNAMAGADTLIMMFGGAIPILSLTTTTQDRPIGVRQSTRDSTVLPNPTVVLTREIIEKALSAPALGMIPSPVTTNVLAGANVPAIVRIGVLAPKPGIIVVDFQDNGMLGAVGLPERPAIYQMYLQVERVP